MNYNMYGDWNAAIGADEIYAYSFGATYGFSFYYEGTNIYLGGLQKGFNMIQTWKERN